MENRTHLHDAERVLCVFRPGLSALLRSVLRGIADALIIGTVFFVVFSLVLSLSFAATYDLFYWVPTVVLSYVAILVRRWYLWSGASFRVTTDRLLLLFPGGLFRPPLRTIKWAQYQESRIARGDILDHLFRVRPVCIRYGSSDGDQMCFPALPCFQDLKHYLDKVDHAVRSGQTQELRAFIAKPRGERFV